MNLNDGKIISDIVEAALTSGDFSKLRDIGPAVQQAVASAITGRPGPPADGIPRSSASTSRYPTGGASIGSNAPGSRPINSSGSFSSPLGHSYDSSSQRHPGYPPPQGYPIQARYQALRPPARGNFPRIPKGVPQIVLSSIGAFSFGLITLVSLVAVPVVSPEFFGGVVALSSVAAVPTIACAVLLATGIGKYNLAHRTTRLAALFERKRVYTFDELAAETGLLPKLIKKDLRKARAQGLLPEVRVDEGETCVMWGEEAYRQYLATQSAHQQKLLEAAERQRRLEDPVTAGIERFRSEGRATIQKIRTANEAIPGEEISAKLDVLEDTTARIFIYVERYPHKLPDTRKFMSYYLPTTLKLVEKYRQFDEMDFQPENIKQAKLDIECALDTINMAFSNLLESLFEHETIDVATDIDVLKKMLEQEGLTKKEFRIDPSTG